MLLRMITIVFFFNDTATTEIYTLSLHDALPILAVEPPREPQVRKRQEERRVHEQVLALESETLRAAPPVADALADARHVADARRADAGVLDEQHAVALRGERAHQFMVNLPVEIPIHRRDADDVAAGEHYRVVASGFSRTSISSL